MLLDCIIAARCNELSAAVHIDLPASVFIFIMTKLRNKNVSASI